MERFIKIIIHYSLFIIIFLFPLFFLPFTQEFFLTNKLYLLAFSGLFLILLSFISFLFSKKISWQSYPLDTPIFLFLITIGLSILINSPNKIQALLNPNFGLVAFASLTFLYFYLSRLSSLLIINYSLLISSLVLSLTTIAFFFHPFKNTNLPTYLQFFKNPLFSPLGNQLDLAIFLGFVIVYNLSQIFIERNNATKKMENKIFHYSFIHYSLLIINFIGLFLTLYSLFAPIPTGSNRFQLNLPSFRLSWYAAVEVLKQPLTALFGIGVDNFSSVFTRVKDVVYNQSNQWQIFSFNYSRSALLHIFTETGLFGLLAFALLVWQLIKISKKNPLPQNLIIHYSLFIILFLPPSLISWFLFFVVLSLSIPSASYYQPNNNPYDDESRSDSSIRTLDLSHLPPVYLGLGVIYFVFLTGCSYLLGRSYLAEYYFKKGLDGVIKNNAKEVYDNTRQAIILNPYIERFRVNFSQINFVIANNIAQKTNQKKQLSETDKQNISQAVQAAIAEAKAAVSLNPQRAENWQNLANIYQQTIGLAQGADIWTISTYQRAIVLDPQNPVYRLNLGGVYYSLGNFEEAAKIFEQTVFLKPDWPNAYYNLAWADYQRGNYQRAVSQMENVLSLLDPQKNKADYDKAKKDLEEFRKKLPEEEQKATESAQPTQLNLPTPVPEQPPPIELPKEASPEAR